MKANKFLTVRNRRKRRRVEPDIPVHVVDSSLKEEGSGNKDKEEKKRKKIVLERKKEKMKTKSKANKQPEPSGSELDMSEDDKQDEVPGPKVEKEMTKERRSEVMKTQKVLTGRVIDQIYEGNPGLRELVDNLKIQG